MAYSQLFKSIPAAVAASLLVAACGGGGGGGGSSGDDEPALTTINEAQAVLVAQNVLTDSAILANGYGTVTDVLSPATIQAAAAGGASSRYSDDNLTLKVIQYARQNRPVSAMNVSAAATEEEVVPCDAGSMRIVAKFASYDHYSIGDSVTVTSQSCVIGGVNLLGSFSATFKGLRGDPYATSDWGISLTATYSGFGATDSSGNGAILTGDMTIALDVTSSSDHATVSGKSLRATHIVAGNAAESTAFNNYNVAVVSDFNQSSFTIAGKSFGSSESLGSYRYGLATPTPFSTLYSDLNPSSGSLVITGSNATVTVIAQDANTVRIDYTDANGTKTQTMTWAQFAS